MSATGSRRELAWVEHLRAGGTTPWAGFGGEDPEAAAAEPELPWLPGGQQLELLRRVNLAGRPDSALVDELLAADLPLRGRLDVGPATVDPARLPARELVRVAAGVLATRARRPGAPQPPRRPALTARVRRRLRPRPFRLAGDPVLADQLRRQLARKGRPPTGRGTVVVVGAGMDRMLADAWWHRVLVRGAADWEHWQRGVLRRDRVPRTADLARTAQRWHRTGSRVCVALDAPAVARATGVRRLVAPPAPDAAVGELTRLIGAVLAVEVPAPERTRLLRDRVLPELAVRSQRSGDAVPLRPSTEVADWAAERQERLHHRLLREGYPVAGEVPVPQAGPVPGPGGSAELADAVLRLAISALLGREGPEGEP